MIKFLDLHGQYQSIKPEIDEAISAVIEDSAFIGGQYVKQFEKDFSNYINVKHCVGVGNGTDAIEIAIEALNLPDGSEIIVPVNSFIASAEAVTRQGHKVVFADVESDSYVLSVGDVKNRITSNTKVIMAVHLYGHPCDMDALYELADEYGLYIIEDCAQAHGAEYKGRKVGGIGDLATFSFYPGKNLGAYGDGGAITTNNLDLAKKCRMFANHGRTEKYNHELEGRNSRLDGIQAAILSVKLTYLNKWIEERERVARLYLKQLKDLKELVLPIRQVWAKQAYHLFVMRTSKRNELQSHLLDNGVQTGIHYPVSLSKLKAYKYLNQYDGTMFGSASSESLLSLPIGEHISEQDVLYISNIIHLFYNGKGD